eukprot:TRINITY_DN18122_c0_g1_i3.p1 TRINITY_DN18122_c0_g1~~TRINITY_DN18122_c0_g1_i3.p1  ORF type:complete len:705 (+),score=184.25 TRINITY_DN18122_c0_g1_i3:66-2180(+)
MMYRGAWMALLAAAVCCGAPDCTAQRCVVITEAQLAELVQDRVLDETQRAHLLEHYADASTAFPPAADATGDLGIDTEDVTALEVVTMFLSTANLFYGTSCLALTVAYVVLMCYTWETPEVQLGVTFVYHFLFHSIAGMLAQTLSSRILAALLYMACCLMPAVCVGILVFSPKYLDQWGLVFRSAAQQVAEEFKAANGEGGEDNAPSRGLAQVARVVPRRAYFYLTALCSAVMVTAGVYMSLGVAFAGIPALFTGAVWVLAIIGAMYSLRYDALQPLFGGGERVAYVSAVYAVGMALPAHTLASPVIRMACLMSALNAGVWSVPVALFMIVRPGPQLDFGAREISKVAETLQQDGNTRYKVWILTNIFLFFGLLQYAVAVRSWLPLPYAVTGLFTMSCAVKADAKWSLVVHLPIALGLCHASFAMMHVVDVQTMKALAWLAPESVLLWVLTTAVRSLTSAVTVVQMTRAAYWLMLPGLFGSVPEGGTRETLAAQPLSCVVHVATMHVVACGLLLLARCEPNGIIAVLAFEFPALAFISGLARTTVSFLEDSAEAVQMQLALAAVLTWLMSRLFVNATGLYLAQFVTIYASCVALNASRAHRHSYAFTFIAAPILAGTGLRHNSTPLIFVALTMVLALVAKTSYEAFESKRISLCVLSGCAIVYVQLGLMFERGDVDLAAWVVEPSEAAFARHLAEVFGGALPPM